MIVTVTLNAAIDRTLLVPNFQLGQRHRASVGFASAGGKESTSRARSSDSALPSSAPGSRAGEQER